MITPEQDFEKWYKKHYHKHEFEFGKEDLKEAFVAASKADEEFVKNSLAANVSMLNRAFARDLLKLGDCDKIIAKLKEYAGEDNA